MTDDDMVNELRAMRKRLAAIEEAQELNRKAAKETLELYESIRGFLTVMALVERISIWLSKIAMAAGIVWWLFRESVKEALTRSN